MLALPVFCALGLWLSGLNLALPIRQFSGFLGVTPDFGFISAPWECWRLNSCSVMRARSRPVASRSCLYPGIPQGSLVLTPCLTGYVIDLRSVVVIFIVLSGWSPVGLHQYPPGLAGISYRQGAGVWRHCWTVDRP